jgi:histone H3/H4
MKNSEYSKYSNVLLQEQSCQKVLFPDKMDQVLRKPVIIKLARSVNLKRISKNAYDELRNEYARFIDHILTGNQGAVQNLLEAVPRRTTLLPKDVEKALKNKGMIYYLEWANLQVNDDDLNSPYPYRQFLRINGDEYEQDDDFWDNRIAEVGDIIFIGSLRKSTVYMWIQIRLREIFGPIRHRRARLGRRAYELIYAVLHRRLQVILRRSKMLVRHRKQKTCKGSDIKVATEICDERKDIFELDMESIIIPEYESPNLRHGRGLPPRNARNYLFHREMNERKVFPGEPGFEMGEINLPLVPLPNVPDSHIEFSDDELSSIPPSSDDDVVFVPIVRVPHRTFTRVYMPIIVEGMQNANQFITDAAYNTQMQRWRVDDYLNATVAWFGSVVNTSDTWTESVETNIQEILASLTPLEMRQYAEMQNGRMVHFDGSMQEKFFVHVVDTLSYNQNQLYDQMGLRAQ